MRFLLSLFFVLGCLVLCCVGVDRSPEFTSALGPSLWLPGEPTPSTTSLSLKLLLRERNLDVVERMAREVSDPLHPKYGQYLSAKELDDLVRPSPESVNAVRNWVRTELGESVKIEEGFRSHLNVELQAHEAEKLLKTRFVKYTHRERSDAHLHRAAGPITLPRDISKHVAIVRGATVPEWVHIGSKISTETAPSNNWFTNIFLSDVFYVTPKVFRAAYGVDYNINAPSLARAAIISQRLTLSNGDMNVDDLKKFYDDNDIPASTINYVTFSSGENSNSPDPDDETSLDIQTLTGIAPGLKTEIIKGDPQGYGDIFDAVRQVLAMDTPPHVISISYALAESGDSGLIYTSDTYMMQLALRGVSVLVASGDSGCYSGNMCFSPSPLYPASSPWVTSVGGTAVNDLSDSEQQVCMKAYTKNAPMITSGGGFSTLFARPQYQNDQVNQYVAKNPLNSYFAGLVNVSNRGYPDISALAHAYSIYVGGVASLVDGTSASSPAIAALVSLINEQRLRNNQPALGFLNPLLYSPQSPFHYTDITSGSNKHTCSVGYHAVPGWDPATGLGSPTWHPASFFREHWIFFTFVIVLGVLVVCSIIFKVAARIRAGSPARVTATAKNPTLGTPLLSQVSPRG